MTSRCSRVPEHPFTNFTIQSNTPSSYQSNLSVRKWTPFGSLSNSRPFISPAVSFVSISRLRTPVNGGLADEEGTTKVSRSMALPLRQNKVRFSRKGRELMRLNNCKSGREEVEITTRDLRVGENRWNWKRFVPTPSWTSNRLRSRLP